MKILVVEDEARMNTLLKEGLEGEGYAVDAVLTGAEGVESAKAHTYDLVLLDCMLPDVDGLDVCRAIRKNGGSMPIIFLTARGRVDDRIDGLDAGGDDYICKPFSFDELLARVRAFLRRSAEENGAGTVLENGNIKMDTVDRSVTKNGHELKLSVTEFDLLECFLRHQGKILSKEQLAKECWPDEEDISTNTVWVYIKKLRDKIGASKIKTVHGFGYKMDAKK
jgi:DNA-binding response OmpR family regulator